MTDHLLDGCRILVVEDEYMLADELATELRDDGAEVLGPAGTVQQALDIIASEPRMDCALLDVNLRGEDIFPVAEMLRERGTPFIFTTGYDQSVIPPKFGDVMRCEKPINIGRVKQALERLLHA